MADIALLTAQSVDPSVNAVYPPLSDSLEQLSAFFQSHVLSNNPVLAKGMLQAVGIQSGQKETLRGALAAVTLHGIPELHADLAKRAAPQPQIPVEQRASYDANFPDFN